MSQQIQGFLQLQSGSECNKTFVTVQNNKLLLFTDDPQKGTNNGALAPFSVFDLQRSQLIENGQFSRPKSFGISTSNGQFLEFSCPTNSVRSSWIKAISESTGGNGNANNGNTNQTMISASSAESSGPSMLIHPSLAQSNATSGVRRASVILAPQSAEQRRSSIIAPTVVTPQPHSQPTMTGPPPSSSGYAPSSSSSGMLVKPVLKKAIGPLPAKRALSNGNGFSPHNSGNFQEQQWIPGNYGNKSFSSRKMSPQRTKDLDESLNSQQHQYHQTGEGNAVQRPFAQLQQAIASAAARSRSAPGPRLQQHQREQQHQQDSSYSNHSSFQHQSQFSSHQSQPHHHQNPNNISEAVPGGVENLTIAQLKQALSAIPSPIRHQLMGSSKPANSQKSAPQSLAINTHNHGYEEDGPTTFEQGSEQQHEGIDDHYQQNSAFGDNGAFNMDDMNISNSNQYSYYAAASEPVEYLGSVHRGNTTNNGNKNNTSRGKPQTQWQQPIKSLRNPTPNNARRTSQQQDGDSSNSPSRRKATTPTQPRRPGSTSNAPTTAGKQRAVSAPAVKTPGRDQPQGGKYATRSTKDDEGLVLGASSTGPGMSTNTGNGLHDRSKGRSTVPRQDVLEWSKNKAWDKHVVSSGYFNNGQAQALPRSSGTTGPQLHLQTLSSSSPDQRHLHGNPSRFSPQEQLKALHQGHGNKTQSSHGQMGQGQGIPPNKDMIAQSLDYYRNRKQVSTTAPSANSSPDPMMRFTQSYANKSRSTTPNAAPVSNNQTGPTQSKANPVSPSFFEFMKSRNGNVSPQRMNMSAQNLNATVGGMRGQGPLQNLTPGQQSSGHGQGPGQAPRPMMSMFPRGPPSQGQGPGVVQGNSNTKFVFSNRPPNVAAQTLPQPPGRTQQQVAQPPHPPFPQQPLSHGVRPMVPRLQVPVAASKSNGNAAKGQSDSDSREMKQVKSHTQQSHGPGEMTDVAEWQRFTTWLNSIGMGCYITVLRDHGVTKLSIIELLGGEDLAQIGIASEDIPIILRKVSELTQRIRSFSEQFAGLGGAGPNNNGKNGNHVGVLGLNLDFHDPSVDLNREQPAFQKQSLQPQQQQTKNNEALPAKGKKLQYKPLVPTESQNRGSRLDDFANISPIAINTARDVAITETAGADLIKSLETMNITAISAEEMKVIKASLLECFDSGDNEKFFHHWERLSHLGLGTDIYTQIGGGLASKTTDSSPMKGANHLDTSALSVITATKRPALLQAKQAMEFHLYLHFCIFPIKHGLSSLKVTKGKEALRKYLESLSISASPAGVTIGLSDALGILSASQSPVHKEQTDGRDTMAGEANMANHKSFTSSREFASYAGLVFVPSPQNNPVYHPLFKDEWTAALRSRLDQFVDVILDAQAASNPPLTSAPTSADPLRVETDDRRKIDDEAHADDEADGDDDEEEEISPVLRPKNLSSTLEIVAENGVVDDLEADSPICEDDNVQRIIGAVDHTVPVAAAITSNAGPETCLSPNSTSSSISQLTDDTPLKNMSNKATGRSRGDPLNSSGGQPSNRTNNHANRPAITVSTVGKPSGVNGMSIPSVNNGPNANQIMMKWAARQQQTVAAAAAAVASGGAVNPNVPSNGQPSVALSSSGTSYSFASNPTIASTAGNSKPNTTSKSALQAQVDNYNRMLRQNKLTKPSPNSSPIHGHPPPVVSSQVAGVPSSGLSANALLNKQQLNAGSSGSGAGGGGGVLPITSKIKIEDQVNKYKALLKQQQQQSHQEQSLQPQPQSAEKPSDKTANVPLPATHSPMVFQSTASVVSQHSRGSRQSHHSTSKRSHHSHHSLHSSHKQVLNDPTHPLNMLSDSHSPFGMGGLSVLIETRKDGEDPVDTVLSPSIVMRQTPPSIQKNESGDVHENDQVDQEEDPNERMIVDHTGDHQQDMNEQCDSAEQMAVVQERNEGLVVDVKEIDAIIDNIVSQSQSLTVEFTHKENDHINEVPEEEVKEVEGDVAVIDEKVDEGNIIDSDNTADNVIPSSAENTSTDDAVIAPTQQVIVSSSSDTDTSAVVDVVVVTDSTTIAITDSGDHVGQHVAEESLKTETDVVSGDFDSKLQPELVLESDTAAVANVVEPEKTASVDETVQNNEQSEELEVLGQPTEVEAEVDGEDEPITSSSAVTSSAAKKKKKKTKK